MLLCVVRSDEMEIIMSDLDRANEVSFATVAFALTVSDIFNRFLHSRSGLTLVCC